MMRLSLIFCFCFATITLCADETPLPLGASDLAPNPRLEGFKPRSVVTMDLEKAFEVEAVKQLDWKYSLEAPSELEILKRENELLKKRVSELERRLAVIEAILAE